MAPSAPSINSTMSSRIATPRPSSYRYKSEKRGMTYNIMLVGQSGLGRRTFLNTLCEREVIPPSEAPNPDSANVADPMKFDTYEVNLEEEGTRVCLTVIDTPGFGDGLDNTSCFKQLQDYIEAQFDEVLVEESRIKRNRKYRDHRIHVLIYFIAPTGHSLRELDIESIRRLGEYVNVVPVIGRADSLTVDELATFKQNIMRDIEYYKLPVYNFCWDESDGDALKENRDIMDFIPFSVVTCDEVLDNEYGSVRVRRYPWGTIEIDDESQCDFALLRYIMLNSHIADLINYTEDVLYENYRTKKLEVGGFAENDEDAAEDADDSSDNDDSKKPE
ncbi:Cell division control protein 11 [Coemansia sp. RSA 1813]|nr:Cell division control protein 11 [Coemansia sp. RSA 1646]KAJ1771625.1 Cell division control protein 11 [Coemansia sp. RSA 1843]KAJ2089927.1 Cell division control protein 11 [Coemansia sp. RSA 986]KAJ2215243.1 Cell division control protein 11 [Coemansia sp. RSA 487]KAJ2571002.1 Cell division control protein 11 [Coemansia sp. RSA 1813]